MSERTGRRLQAVLLVPAAPVDPCMLAQSSGTSPSHPVTRSTAALLVNLLAFQLGWFACVLGAAWGRPWLGPLVALPVLLWHLHNAGRPGREALLLATAGLLGLVLDSALVLAGRLSFTQGILIAGLAPYWMVTLWALFASTFNVSLRWLRDRLPLAALFGAVGGPLAYLAGARLGAAHIMEPAWLGHLAVAAVYALATPALLVLARRLDGFAPAAAADRP